LGYAALYSFLTACVLLAAYLFATTEMREWIEEDVRARLWELREIHETEGLDSVLEQIRREGSTSERSSMIYQLSDGEGTFLGGNARGIPDFKGVSLVRQDAISVAGEFDSDVTRFLVRQIMLGDTRLVVGKSTHLYWEASEVLIEVMATGFLVLLFLGLVLGALLGRRTEQRILAISEVLTGVSDGHISRRISVGRTGDDLDRVSHAINGALRRLQALIESQQQISTDIAHDLKTPIQRLRQRLERARPRDEETAGMIEASIADTEAIIATFHALLRISQIEAGARRERFCETDLRQVCEAVASAFEAVAEDEGQVFVWTLPDEAVLVQGDADLLTQLTANVVENAIRHCPPETRIELSLGRDGTRSCLSIRDTGSGIPADERDRVMRRLYRLEKSRTTPGNGLGLSLVKAIADLHGATIELVDNDPGLAVHVVFPDAKSAAVRDGSGAATEPRRQSGPWQSGPSGAR